MNKLIIAKKFDKTTNDQLRRASFSIMLNIDEGSSPFSNKDRKNFMVVARGSKRGFQLVFKKMDFLSEYKNRTI